MKNKIIYLIIGIILGVVITFAGFFVYNKVHKNDFQNRERPAFDSSHRQKNSENSNSMEFNADNQVKSTNNQLNKNSGNLKESM